MIGVVPRRTRRGRTFSRRCSVVLVQFPFSDFSQSKLRPAICLAGVGLGDFVLCQVTSKPYGDPRAEPIGDADFSTGGLRLASVARPGKLFTASETLIISIVGSLNAHALDRIVGSVIALLGRGRDNP